MRTLHKYIFLTLAALLMAGMVQAQVAVRISNAPTQANPGDLITVRLDLGDAANQLTSFRGVGFDFRFDPTFIDPASFAVSYTGSDLGQQFVTFVDDITVLSDNNRRILLSPVGNNLANFRFGRLMDISVRLRSNATPGAVFNLTVDAASVIDANFVAKAVNGSQVAINVAGLAVCNAPAGFSTTNVTTNSGNVSWGAVAGAVSYEVTTIIPGQSPNNVQNTSATSFTLTGLPAGTAIGVSVRANCGSTSFSVAGTTSFTTQQQQQTCATPAGFSAANVTTNGGTVSWGAVPGASGYEVTTIIPGQSPNNVQKDRKSVV